MPSESVSPHLITELRRTLKQAPTIPIEAELDILKALTPLQQWKKAQPTKDHYAVRVARLVWIVWKEIESIWPDFHCHDYCLVFDLHPTDQEFYYIEKEVGEIAKYLKSAVDLQSVTNVPSTDFHSCVFLQHHSHEHFSRREFLWHPNWTPDYCVSERHYENDFEFFPDNTCLGQFSYVTALLIRDWLAEKHNEYHVQMETKDLQRRVSSLIRATKATDKYVNYLAPTEVQRLHAELSHSLSSAIQHLTDNQIHLNDALARLIRLKTDYRKEWYDNNWYCPSTDGLLRYLMMSISLHATFDMNLNLRSTLEYDQIFMQDFYLDCSQSSRGRVYELASIQFLTAILCDLGEEDPGRWKRSYNGRILHTLHKHGLHSPAIRPELRDNEQIEAFFSESIIQAYHHFPLFAKKLQHKGSKFLILPNESSAIKDATVSYYAPSMKHLLDGNMWTKYIRHLTYSSDCGTVVLNCILIGEICLLSHHIFIIPLLHNGTLTSNQRLVVHSNQIEINVSAIQQETQTNPGHIYFVVHNHREQDYSNVLTRANESNTRCVLS